jgi:hypothetical protein
LALKEAKEIDEASLRSAAEEARETADEVVIVPRCVLLGEGVEHRLRVAPLAAVEGRAEGDIGAEVAPVDFVAFTPLCPVGGAVLPGEGGEGREGAP